MNRNLIIGVDLNKEDPQVCYYDTETENTVVASMKDSVEGVSLQDILDELEVQSELPEEDTDVDMILDMEQKASDILRQTLEDQGITDPELQIEGITVTVPKLDRHLVELIRFVYEDLGIESGRGFLQDYKESFYYHTLYQKKEYWNRNVGFFRFDDRQVSFYSLTMNQQTRPITCMVSEGVSITLKEDKSLWDEQFCNMINASLRQNIYSCIFIMGETFSGSWGKRSVPLLCKGGRKVFMVDNLFARGACYAARERVLERRLGDYLYLGDDLVRNNIGMQMIVQGNETYYPLISAGVNWYDTEKTVECLLDDEAALEFVVSAMDSKKQNVLRMELPGMPERPDRTTRIRLHLEFESPTRCVVEAEDLGFGDLFPASGQIWREILEG
ncbi:MAG: DUF5716 family protein [Eubacteriales bacterium]|nr:DUF5716 family protein [Eubacteriales bacterium]